MEATKARQDLLSPWIELTRFWAELEPVSRHELWNGADLLEYEQGDVITVQFGLMISGTAAMEYVLANGRRSLVELFHSGDLLDASRHERQPQGKMIALGYCALISLDSEEFERCARHHQDVLSAYRKQLQDQTGRLRDHINDLAVKTPIERIVATLFELRRWPEDDKSNVATTALPILRKDIAAYLGLRPETLSRALKKLTHHGLISIGPESDAITLNDLPKLRLVANGKGQKLLGDAA
ncbi:MAG: Crp/Fnr family transcriptional regulator [Pseudomonadota bacterium]